MREIKQKKIAFLLFSLAGGGEERIASILAKHLSESFDLHIVLFNPPIEFDLPKGIKLKILRSYSQHRFLRLITLPLILFRYFHYCRTERISLSLSFDTLANFINCGLSILGWQGKILLREVNYPSTRFQPTSLYGHSSRFLIKKLYPKADKIFVNAQRIATDLKKNFDINVPIELMLNPIDFKLIEQERVITLPNSNTPKFIFISVAGFRPEKNHQLLIDAFAKIKHLEVELWLLGQGKTQPHIKKKVKNLNLEKQVHFLGFQKYPFKFMATANCMVMSSDFEGLPNVIIEGLACGLPIISTNCPSGPREIIAPKSDSNKQLKKGIEVVEYGILTPIGNAYYLAKAMTKVYHNKSFQKPEKYKKRARDFDVNVILKDFENLL